MSDPRFLCTEVSLLSLHLVWWAEYRKGLLSGSVLLRLNELLGGIARKDQLDWLA